MSIYSADCIQSAQTILTCISDNTAMDGQGREDLTRSKIKSPDKTGSGRSETYSCTIDPSFQQPKSNEIPIQQRSPSSHPALSANMTKSTAVVPDVLDVSESGRSRSIIRHSEDVLSHRTMSIDRSSSVARSTVSTVKAKKCYVCKQAQSGLMPLIRCSKCRRRYHRGCHNPSILNEPR